MIEKNNVSFYNNLVLLKFVLSKCKLSFMYINVHLIIYKVMMMIIDIFIPGKIKEWGFVLN